MLPLGHSPSMSRTLLFGEKLFFNTFIQALLPKY